MGFKITFVSQFLLLLLVMVGSYMADDEPECQDVSPCSCVVFRSALYVRCDHVPMEELQELFSFIPPFEMKSLFLVIQPSGDFIPADVLDKSRVTDHLNFVGQISSIGMDKSDEPYPVLKVDPNAFRNSDTIGGTIFFNSLDLSQTDFSFLKGIQKTAKELSFVKVTNLDKSLHTLSAMPALTSISITSSTGLKEAFKANENMALSGNGLVYFRAGSCDLDTEGLSKVLDWILPSSAKTLRSLEFDSNKLDTIPSQVSSFKRLANVNVRENKVPLTLKTNSINLAARKKEDTGSIIYFTESPLVLIESGAFRGNYSSTIINLVNSSLTRFEEGVFKSVLQDMFIGGEKYYIDVNENSFDCNTDLCHLAWLLRDNCHLLDFNLKNARCDDGTYFTDMSRNLFAKCPGNSEHEHNVWEK